MATPTQPTYAELVQMLLRGELTPPTAKPHPKPKAAPKSTGAAPQRLPGIVKPSVDLGPRIVWITGKCGHEYAHACACPPEGRDQHHAWIRQNCVCAKCEDTTPKWRSASVTATCGHMQIVEWHGPASHLMGEADPVVAAKRLPCARCATQEGVA